MTGASAQSRATRRTVAADEKWKEECPLFMDCTDEGLSEAQKRATADKTAKFTEQMKKLEAMAKAGARIIQHDNGSVTFRVTETSTLPTSSSPMNATAASPANVVNSAPGGGQAVRLLMDPRTGRILGTLNQNGTVGPAPPGMAGTAAQPSLRGVVPPQQRVMRPAVAGGRALLPAMPGNVNQNRSVRAVRQPAVVDLTRDDSRATNSDKARQFPALTVSARPQKVANNLAGKRGELDTKVKALLVQPAAKFTEWLIQQGLVPPEQYCSITKKKLKLGMYSDSKKFPHSGGYVWISEGSGSQKQYTSVFKGSVFEATNHSPTVVLKLLYHWACQTNIQNVVQWVKVDHTTINLFFQMFRSVCICSVQEEVVNMGGHTKAVEIGVISLGTTSADGTRREVRVEILGVLDRSTGNFRLRATEPRPGASQAERFNQILAPLPVWVLKGSKILTDYSIDKDRLKGMGYTNIVQCNASAQNRRTTDSNGNVMDYLKKIVPKMFQNSLSLLTTSAIQQFLDELTFRELCGHYPLLAFDSLVQRISNQTAAAMERGTTFGARMKSVSSRPSDDWRITMLSQPEDELGTGIDYLPQIFRDASSTGSRNAPSPGSKRAATPEGRIDSMIAKKMRTTSDLVRLEEYFYARMDGDTGVLQSEFKADMAFKCHVCKKLYMNNVEFMKHLSLHVESERAAVDTQEQEMEQCKYCYKDFDTSMAVDAHIAEAHWKTGVTNLETGEQLICRICEEMFQNKNLFIYHMSNTHYKSEMPYACQVCGFRCSFLRDLIDHFQEAHDRTDKLQCPRCLKIFSLSSDKGAPSNGGEQFVQHLLQHKEKSIKCKKCCLHFVTNQLLTDHMHKDHVSFKGFDNVEAYSYMGNEEGIQMPRPDERVAKIAKAKAGVVKPSQQAAFAAQNLEDLLMYDVENEDVCGECRKRFNSKGHFTAYLCCTKCRYSTCCTKAISLHVALFHSEKTKTPTYDLGAPVYLGKDVFCCCGFKTDSGNKMAKHLATSGCSTAYPDAETAKRAVRGWTGGGQPATLAPPAVPPADNGDEITSYDPNEEMAKAYLKDKGGAERSEVPAGPLTFLGLQQKKDGGEEDDVSKGAESGHSKDGNPTVGEKLGLVGSVLGENGCEGNKNGEGASAAVEDQHAADDAPSEAGVKESEEASRSESATTVAAMDASDTAARESVEQELGPAASCPTDMLPQGDSVDKAEAHPVSSRDAAQVAENSAENAAPSGEATNTAAAVEGDASVSLATEAMETDHAE